MSTPFKAEYNGVTADEYAAKMTRVAEHEIRGADYHELAVALLEHGKRWETLHRAGIDTVSLLERVNNALGVGTDWADKKLQKFLDVAIRKVEIELFTELAW